MIINILCSLLGVTVCCESYTSFYITLFSRLVFIKLITLPILLPTSKKDTWHCILGMSVFLPLAMIPSSYLYFYYLLPELFNLKLILVGYIKSISDLVKNCLDYLKFIYLNIIYLKLTYLKDLCLKLNIKYF